MRRFYIDVARLPTTVLVLVQVLEALNRVTFVVFDYVCKMLITPQPDVHLTQVKVLALTYYVFHSCIYYATWL